MINKSLITSNLPNNYICSTADTSWGEMIWVMRNDGKAFVQLYRYYNCEQTLIISDLTVEVDARKKGIAKEIMSFSEKIAITADIPKIALWVVDENCWVYNWYKRIGYEDWKKEEDRFWLMKKL
jgi:GNAT superfamily N-acetyltransferase